MPTIWNVHPDRADWYFSVVVEVFGERSVIDGYAAGDKPTLPKLRRFTGWEARSQLKPVQWMVLRASDPSIVRDTSKDHVPVFFSIEPGYAPGIKPGGGATALHAGARRMRPGLAIEGPKPNGGKVTTGA